MIRQGRIKIAINYAKPDGKNRDKTLIKSKTDLKYFRKVVIDYLIAEI